MFIILTQYLLVGVVDLKVLLSSLFHLFCFQFWYGVFISNLIADNVFTSLVGLQFMWQLMPETDRTHHLVHVPLKDSPLSDCGGLCGDLEVQKILENSVCIYLRV